MAPLRGSGRVVRNLEIMPEGKTVGEKETQTVLSTGKIERVVLCKKLV